ncbi:stage II sporulation protein M [Macrococcus brunensis]|uniref:stage II sporulation protein M n=1 Tax=Macrococcus brunensis TaxID=198483 RepID=UPI001EF0D7D2|nr:stage II sporulation protein M [Macrococcus brunensis]ULG74243.1 stage II sporulation protein M [Macrococcus brunensis]
MKNLEVSYIKRAFIIYAIMILVAILTFIISLVIYPSEELFEDITSKLPSNSVELKGLDKVWMYVVNNGFIVPLQMFILSLIPIPFLYFLNVISTTIITGIIFGFAIHLLPDFGWILVLSSIPHALIEILAFCFVASGLWSLNRSIISKVSSFFRKEKRYGPSISESIYNLIRVYVFIALPLFIIAAFAETYLTDFIEHLLK